MPDVLSHAACNRHAIASMLRARSGRGARPKDLTALFRHHTQRPSSLSRRGEVKVQNRTRHQIILLKSWLARTKMHCMAELEAWRSVASWGSNVSESPAHRDGTKERAIWLGTGVTV